MEYNQCHDVYQNGKIKIPDFFQTYFLFTSANLYNICEGRQKVMSRIFVCTKEATMRCDTHAGEAVHSNEGLCKVLGSCVALLKYFCGLKMELPLPGLSEVEHRTTIRYFTMLYHTVSNINEKLMEVYTNLISYDIIKRWHREFPNKCMKRQLWYGVKTAWIEVVMCCLSFEQVM